MAVRFFLILLFLLAFRLNLKCDEEIDYKFLLERMFVIPKWLENQPTLGFKYSISTPTIPLKHFASKLSNTYSFDLSYGFTRFEETDEYGLENILYYASESASIENISSHLKPSSINKDITSDNWNFGFCYKNGYANIFPNSSFLTFYHSSSIEWTHLDIELAALNERDQKEFDKFDEKFKFGSCFEAGIMYNITDVLNFDISYFHSLTYQNTEYGKWLGASFLELILQRTIDFWSFEIVKNNAYYGPFLNFLCKNSCSFILYEFRRKKQFFPFNSEYALSYDGVKFGFTFTF